jgi:hypothetical protein
MLECELPPTPICEAVLRSLGQDLFAPPNVKGWDGGITWITTNTLLARYNDAAMLVQGTFPPLSASDFARKPGGQGGARAERQARRVRIGGVNVDKIVAPEELADKDLLVKSLEHRLLQTTLKDEQRKALRDFLDARPKLDDADVKIALRLVMATPQYQVT